MTRYKVPVGSRLLKLGNQLFPSMSCEFTEEELEEFMLEICNNDKERAREGMERILETCKEYEVKE